MTIINQQRRAPLHCSKLFHKLPLLPGLRTSSFNLVSFFPDIPQPSVEYPLVLFPGSDYSSVSNNGDYVRVKEGEYHVWGRTVADQERQFVYRSLIVMPNRTLTFKGSPHIFHGRCSGSSVSVSDLRLACNAGVF